MQKLQEQLYAAISLNEARFGNRKFPQSKREPG